MAEVVHHYTKAVFYPTHLLRNAAYVQYYTVSRRDDSNSCCCRWHETRNFSGATFSITVTSTL